MKGVMRILVGLVGLFNIVIGLAFLLDPATAGQRFFLAALGTQGLATMRADFTAFFVVGGACALLGARRGDRAPLLVPMALLAVALTGRAVSLVADGAPSSAVPPMIVEAAMIAILALAARAFAGARR